MRQRLLILAAAVLFSTGGTVIKAVSLTHWQVACFRSGLAGLALWLAFPTWRRDWDRRTVAVGIAYAATMIMFVTGNKMTTAANTIFLQSTAPLYVFLLGPLLLREAPRTRDWWFAASLAVGLALFFVGTEPQRLTAPAPAAGNWVAACSGLTWALTLVGLRWLGKDLSSNPSVDRSGAAVVVGNGIAFAVCLPLALPIAGPETADWVLVPYLGLFQIGLAYVCLTRGVRGLPALEVSLLLLLEPVLSAFWAWLVHAERPGPWSLAGCSIILGATLARTLARPPREAGPAP